MKKNFKKIMSLALIATMLCTQVPIQAVNAKSSKKSKLSNSKVTLNVGSSKTIKLKNYSKLSKKKIKQVKWTSSKKGIVSLKTSGKYKQNCKITAKKTGTTTVKLKYNNKTYKCTVKVYSNNNKDNKVTTENQTTENTHNNTTTEEKTTEHKHEYTNWTINKEPTCGEAGNESRKCNSCGKVENRDIPATGKHVSTNGGTKDCHSKCSVCGMTLNDSSYHTYTDTIVKSATCAQTGIVRHDCSCGYSYVKEIPKSTTHSFIANNRCVLCGELIKENAVKTCDISENQDGSITLYAFEYKSTKSNSTFYDIYIESEFNTSKIKDCKQSFNYINGSINFLGTGISTAYIRSITFMNNMQASNSTYGMFRELGKAYYDKTGYQAIIHNLENFNTSNTTNMNFMFQSAVIGENITIPLNTKNVKKMEYMFNDMEYVNSISFGNNFNTSNVESMKGMFQNMYRCKSINCNNFNTKNVIDMSYMFANIGNELNGNIVFNLDLSSFNTANVKYMTSMFENMCFSCNIDNFKLVLGNNFSTKSAINVKHMFTKTGSTTIYNKDNLQTSYIDLGIFGLDHSNMTDFKDICVFSNTGDTYFIKFKTKYQSVIDWFISSGVMSSSYFY